MTLGLPKCIATYEISAGERNLIEVRLSELAAIYSSAEQEDFIDEARQIAYTSFSRELLQFLNRFYRKEVVPAVVISGCKIDDEKIGPTPSHWNQHDRSRTLKEEMLLVLFGSVLGDLFAWSSLQNGNLIHNVVPIRGQEHEQSGHGSLTSLNWHTEDGFHPYRCDYLGLMALRNSQRIPTTFATMREIQLDASDRATLFQPRFFIRPDNEHLSQRGREENRGNGACDPNLAQWGNPPAGPVLFGDRERPYLRIDPTFMTTPPNDPEAERSLRRVVNLLEAGLKEIVLQPGMICFIDNYQAIHGRPAFTPAYNGKDRWLKKVLVTRDLRKSRSLCAAGQPVLTPVMDEFFVNATG